MKNLISKVLYGLTVSLAVVSAQDLDPFFRFVAEGQIQRVRDELPALLEQYPNHPGVLFLDAVTRERAEDAIIVYKKLAQNYPDSPYADDAVMKVGEYLFARGLYTQSSREFSKVPNIYPRSEHVQRAIDLQINSLMAIGESDSAQYYVRRYQSRFPSLDLDYSLESGNPLVKRPLTSGSTPQVEGMKQPSVSSLPALPKPERGTTGEAVTRRETVIEPEVKREPPKVVQRPYVIQVGAFGSSENAIRQKMTLEQIGYEVDLVPITSRGKKLQAVQVVRFATRNEAQELGEKLKKDLGYGYIVLQRPE